MRLDELICSYFSQQDFVKESFATYAKTPAIFYQSAPDDKQPFWDDRQYPRAVFVIDTQANAQESCRLTCTATLNTRNRKCLSRKSVNA